MSRQSKSPRPARRPKGAEVGSAEFKARCLELLDHVRDSGAAYVVTKHGRPVAEVVPYRRAGAPTGFGALKGSVLAYERPFDPIDGEYDVNRD